MSRFRQKLKWHTCCIAMDTVLIVNSLWPSDHNGSTLVQVTVLSLTAPKALHETTLIYYQRYSVAFILEQFHKSSVCSEIAYSKLMPKLTGASELSLIKSYIIFVNDHQYLQFYIYIYIYIYSAWRWPIYVSSNGFSNYDIDLICN